MFVLNCFTVSNARAEYIQEYLIIMLMLILAGDVVDVLMLETLKLYWCEQRQLKRIKRMATEQEIVERERERENEREKTDAKKL